MNDPLILSPLIAWVGALSLLLNFALSLYSLLSSGSRANRTMLEAHEAALNTLEGRIAAVEQSLRILPSTGDLHKIELALSRMEGELGIMGQRLQPVAAIAERMQEMLIQQSKR